MFFRGSNSEVGNEWVWVSWFESYSYGSELKEWEVFKMVILRFLVIEIRKRVISFIKIGNIGGGESLLEREINWVFEFYSGEVWESNVKLKI